ncbi:MAG: hypothetical protein IPM96_22040 [Ignavibacteria bacterium]|nr:hypothetical protein [Ignavibacteria bacterium]
MEKNKFINKISSLLFYISILTFIIPFNSAHNPPWVVSAVSAEYRWKTDLRHFLS